MAETEKPPMPDLLRELAQQAKRRHRTRSAPPPIVTNPKRMGGMHYLTCPYRDEDEDLWFALLLECFGTRMLAVADAFMQQVASLCPEVLYEGEDRTRLDEGALHQALAIVYALKVRNEAEAALAAQLVAVHFATMKVGKTAGRYDWLPLPHANCLAALVKTYSGGLKALRDMKGGRGRTTRQVIRVERANVYVDQRGRGVGNPGSQADEGSGKRARATPSGSARILPALSRPDEIGDALQTLPGEGPDPLPPARWGEGLGGAEG